MTTDLDPPFTEAELRAARAQINMRRCTEAMAGLAEALQESLRKGFAELEEGRQRAARAAAERKKRIDAAEQWLLAQEADQS